MSGIIIIGSSNTDMVIKADSLPMPGETVLGGRFFSNAGGKGANQAVAVARLSGSGIFVAKVGNDVFGQQAKALLNSEGLDTAYVFTDPELPSGIALITVNAAGENCIVVAQGANAALHPEDLSGVAKHINSDSIVLMQLESPLETVAYVAALVAEKRGTFILNPAPAQVLPNSLLKHVSILTPNENEAVMITGVPITDDVSSVEKAAYAIRARGVDTVIITLGSKGAFVLHEQNCFLVPAPLVAVADTTAAGDVFNGALAVALSEGRAIRDAVSFACKAAALSVTKLGAQASVPYRVEMDKNPFESDGGHNR